MENLLTVINNIDGSYLTDIRAISSLTLFIVSLIAGCFLFWDVFRSRKLVINCWWKTTTILQAVNFLSLSVYGGAKFIIVLVEKYMYPTIEGKLLFEIPLFGISITIMVYIIFYSLTYAKYTPTIAQYAQTSQNLNRRKEDIFDTGPLDIGQCRNEVGFIRQKKNKSR